MRNTSQKPVLKLWRRRSALPPPQDSSSESASPTPVVPSKPLKAANHTKEWQQEIEQENTTTDIIITKSPNYDMYSTALDLAKEHYMAREVSKKQLDNNNDFNTCVELLLKEDLHVLHRARCHDLLSKIHSHLYTAVDHRDAKYHSQKAVKYSDIAVKKRVHGANTYLIFAKQWGSVLKSVDDVFASVKEAKDDEAHAGAGGRQN